MSEEGLKCIVQNGKLVQVVPMYMPKADMARLKTAMKQFKEVKDILGKNLSDKESMKQIRSVLK